MKPDNINPQTWALHEEIQHLIHLFKWARRTRLQEIMLVGLAAVFLFGQVAGASLQIWGWPSEWF